MSNVNRRDFLKTSVAVSAGFVSVNGLLLPQASFGMSKPIAVIGRILTSLLQVITAYLAARNSYKLSSFNDQYNPYDYFVASHMNIGNLSGGISQNLLYSENTGNPINGFSNRDDNTILSVQQGQAYMSNGYQSGKYDPSELRIAHQYHENTGYELFPSQNQATGYYNVPETRQRDLFREQAKGNRQLSELGELGQDYTLQGFRKFKDDRGNDYHMAKLQMKNNPNLKTVLIDG